jgi:hypothetical protein
MEGIEGAFVFFGGGTIRAKGKAQPVPVRGLRGEARKA